MQPETLEVHDRVHRTRSFEQGHETGRDGERRTVAERPEVRERGAGEEHIAKRTGMDDEAAPAHADTRPRGEVPLTRVIQRGAT